MGKGKAEILSKSCKSSVKGVKGEQKDCCSSCKSSVKGAKGDYAG